MNAQPKIPAGMYGSDPQDAHDALLDAIPGHVRDQAPRLIARCLDSAEWLSEAIQSDREFRADVVLAIREALLGDHCSAGNALARYAHRFAKDAAESHLASECEWQGDLLPQSAINPMEMF